MTHLRVQTTMGLMAVAAARSLAVVMGDLVQSERSPDVKTLHARFNASITAQNAARPDILASPLTITLGDEFQGLATSLSGAVPLVRDLRLELMANGIECRFVIGLVELETPLNPSKAWNMMGPGLSRARDKLNEKRVSSLYRFSLASDPLMETMLDALGAGLTAIERKWTRRQLKDITALLGGLSPAELAKVRNVSVHTIYKVRGSGDFDAYSAQWHAISEALAVLDKHKGLK